MSPKSLESVHGISLRQTYLGFPLVLALVLFLGPSEAYADKGSNERVLTSEQQHYQVHLPAKSVDIKPPIGLLAASSLGPLTMSLSRIEGNNIRAYRRRDKKQFFSEVLAGVERDSKLTLTRSSIGTKSKPPFFDLQLLRQNQGGSDEIVWMRLLFFRRYTIVASAAVPSKGARKYEGLAKRFTTSLVHWSHN